MSTRTPKKILLSVCADGWSGGKNIATLKASKQTLAGAIKVGNDSTLNLELSDGSSFEGSVDGKISTAKGESVSTEVGTVVGGPWTAQVPGRSARTAMWSSFNGNAANVTANGHTLYVNGVALTGTK